MVKDSVKFLVDTMIKQDASAAEELLDKDTDEVEQSHCLTAETSTSSFCLC
jgi:hypothetical protein